MKKAALPQPPSHISEEASSWWTHFTSEWELDDAALLILEGTMEAFDRMRQAQAIIETEGITMIDRFKQIKQHPATLVERDSRNAVRSGLKALGLDLEPLNDRPGSRGRSKS